MKVKLIINKYLSLNLKVLALLLLFLLSRTESIGQVSTFDKEQWRTKSEYRYSIVKDSVFYKMVIGKNKNEIYNILDKPNFREKNKLGYCLDLCRKDMGNKCKKKSCPSSLIIIEMKNRKSSDLIVIWKGN